MQGKARAAATSERTQEVDNHAGVIADLLAIHSENPEAKLRPAGSTGSASSSAVVFNAIGPMTPNTAITEPPTSHPDAEWEGIGIN